MQGEHDQDGKRLRAEEVARRAEERRLRAAEKLRDNLLRRKQQVRARRAGQADETDGLPAAKMDES
ncbi:hypothetical protein [Rhizobium sp. RAF56]|uniref:hypothetical protein n=1 Tax=Rhizobium sp. RAF56 TaxID=3233062 RepID=UPI003F99FBB0